MWGAIIFAFWLLLIFASGFCFGRASSYPRQDARDRQRAINRKAKMAGGEA